MFTDVRVTIEPTFFWQLDLGLLGETLSLVCPRCYFTFPVPEDWVRDNEGMHPACPSCAHSAAIPTIPG